MLLLCAGPKGGGSGCGVRPGRGILWGFFRALQLGFRAVIWFDSDLMHVYVYIYISYMYRSRAVDHSGRQWFASHCHHKLCMNRLIRGVGGSLAVGSTGKCTSFEQMRPLRIRTLRCGCRITYRCAFVETGGRRVEAKQANSGIRMGIATIMIIVVVITICYWYCIRLQKSQQPLSEAFAHKPDWPRAAVYAFEAWSDSPP